MPPLIVEFTGLPGAGKTTITNAVISELTKEGYDCFPSRTLDNSKTVERKVLGPMRIMGPCMGMGHAAGLASALALKQGIKYAEVNVKELQEMLIQEKCLLPI